MGSVSAAQGIIATVIHIIYTLTFLNCDGNRQVFLEEILAVAKVPEFSVVQLATGHLSPTRLTYLHSYQTYIMWLKIKAQIVLYIQSHSESLWPTSAQRSAFIRPGAARAVSNLPGATILYNYIAWLAA